MFLQIAIALVLLSSIIGLAVWFFNERKTINFVHNETILALERAMSNSCTQIEFRKNNLNNYDLLRYNLQEALVVQPQIEI